MSAEARKAKRSGDMVPVPLQALHLAVRGKYGCLPEPLQNPQMFVETVGVVVAFIIESIRICMKMSIIL